MTTKEKHSISKSDDLQAAINNIPKKLKKTKYAKKDGVEFKMMFRHHKDPLYYDLNANSKIFVPIEPDNKLDENKRKIIESFPAEDRGKVLEPEEYKKKGYGQQD